MANPFVPLVNFKLLLYYFILTIWLKLVQYCQAKTTIYTLLQRCAHTDLQTNTSIFPE